MNPLRPKDHSIEPGGWPERTGRPRVLVENPDQATLWAHQEILREAGYDVASCAGPNAEGVHVPWFGRGTLQLQGSETDTGVKRTTCPLVEGQGCALVDGADVIVVSTDLVDGRSIIAAHRTRGASGLVVEGPHGTLAAEGLDSGVVVEEPVTEERLLAAVAEALRQRPPASA